MLRQVLSSIIPLLLFGCGLPYSSVTTTAPTDTVAVKDMQAVVNYRRSCWDGCKNYEDIEFYVDREEISPEIYQRDVGTPFQPYTRGVLQFPKTQRLITIFVHDGMTMVTAVQGGKKTSLVPLVGCIEIDNKLHSNWPLPRQDERLQLQCKRRDRFWQVAVYSAVHSLSYHGDYWIDYIGEAVHEIAAPVNVGYMVGVVSVNSNRSHILMAYRLRSEHSYMVCAFGQQNALPSYDCVRFISRDRPPRPPAYSSIVPKLPVEYAGIVFTSAGAKDHDVQLRDWVARYVDAIEENGLISLSPQKGVVTLDHARGLGAPPYVQSKRGCGRCSQ